MFSSSEFLLGDEVVEGLDTTSFSLSMEVRGDEPGCVDEEACTSAASDTVGCSGLLFVRVGRVKDEGGNNTVLRSAPPVGLVWIGGATEAGI